MDRWLAYLAAVAIGVAAHAGEDKPSVFHTPPRQAIAGEPFSVEGLLIEGGKIDKLFLRYRSPGEPFRTVEMEVQYGDLYRAVVPAKAVEPPALEYFIQGVTFDGAPVLLYQSERRPVRVKVVPAPAPPPRVEPLVPRPPPSPPPVAPDAGTTVPLGSLFNLDLHVGAGSRAKAASSQRPSGVC